MRRLTSRPRSPFDKLRVRDLRYYRIAPRRICPGYSASGGGGTRTYEGLASGFTVRPLCRSGHSPVAGTGVRKRLGKPEAWAGDYGDRDYGDSAFN